VTIAPATLKLREIRAQAAVWVTDLHGPGRDAEIEAGVRRWLAEDPRHAAAFELATDAWQRSGNLHARVPLHSLLSTLPSRDRGQRRARRFALAGATALCVGLIATFYFLKDPTLSTGVAEQKTIDLADGTQVTLNANSRLTVEYSEQVRKVTLARGEAFFNVTKHPTRPFVVVIGSRKVVALGTSFEVRREDASRDNFSVTLIEGRVAVEPLRAPDQLLAPNTLPADLQQVVTLLDPGQRLRMAANKPDALDTPPMDKVTAWQRGQLIFEDTSLRAAAAEFNRYGKRRLTIDPSVSEKLRVGGVFRIGDPDSFAHAMASAYQLRIVERDEEINLTAP
jgi:transmembrane sensor